MCHDVHAPLMTRQFAVFLENRPGALAELTGVLAEAGVNIESIMIEGVHDFGFARVCATPVGHAERALKDAGFQFRTTEAIVVRMPNKPGALHEALEKLGAADINVGSLFGSTGAEEAEIVIDVADAARAREVLGLK